LAAGFPAVGDMAGDAGKLIPLSPPEAIMLTDLVISMSQDFKHGSRTLLNQQ